MFAFLSSLNNRCGFLLFITSLTFVSPKHSHRGVTGNVIHYPVLHWTAHRGRLYLESAASNAEVWTGKTIHTQQWREKLALDPVD